MRHVASKTSAMSSSRVRSYRGERGRGARFAAQGAAERSGEELRVAERVGDAVSADRIAVIPRVADEGPARSPRAAYDVREAGRAADRRSAGRGFESGREGGRDAGQDLRERNLTLRAPHAVHLHRRRHDPDARLAAIGRKDPGEGAVAQVKLEAVAVQAGVVRVVSGRGRRARLGLLGPDCPRNAGANPVGADDVIRA